MVPYMADNNNNTKTTVYLDPLDYQQLQRLARERGTSAAFLVREAVAEYAAKHVKSRRPRSMGMGRSGRKDLGANAEKYLKGLGND